MLAALDSVMVTLVAGDVIRTRGVQLSVYGGQFQVFQLVGTVRACIVIEKLAVWLPFVTEVTLVKSGTVIGSRLVELV
jgi:hypothetical protein